MGYADERFRQQRLAKHAKPKPHYKVSWGDSFLALHSSISSTVHEAATGTRPDPDLKGKLNGNCNREACQAPGATWWNTSTRQYYCAACARDINRACLQFGEPRILFQSAGAEADAAMNYGDERHA